MIAGSSDLGIYLRKTERFYVQYTSMSVSKLRPLSREAVFFALRKYFSKFEHL